jgi:hypothetical protein
VNHTYLAEKSCAAYFLIKHMDAGWDGHRMKEQIISALRDFD